MGDLNTRRVAAFGQVVPPAMKIALALAATVAMGWVGCGIGLGPRRNVVMPVVLSILFGFLIANEERLYEQLQTTGMTFISVGHRPSLVKYHHHVLELVGDTTWRLYAAHEYLPGMSAVLPGA